MQTRDFTRSRWWMPASCLFLGTVFLFGRRSETLQGLGGPGRDERWAMIDLRATALAGVVTILFVLGAWLYEVARGEDGSEFALIGFVAGLSYVAVVAVLRWRG